MYLRFHQRKWTCRRTHIACVLDLQPGVVSTAHTAQRSEILYPNFVERRFIKMFGLQGLKPEPPVDA